MASWLATGEGGGQGLEEVLRQMVAEKLRQDALNEQVRHNQADEGLHGLDIQERAATRREIAAEREAGRTDANNLREDQNVMRRVALRPIGADVTPQEKTEETQHGIPFGNYKFVPANMGMSTPQGEVGPTPDRQTWQGTQDQLTRRETAEKERGVNSEVKAVKYHGKVVDANYNPRTQQYTLPGGQDITAEVEHYEKPPAPDRVIVNTAEGLVRRSDLSGRLGKGETVEGPLPAMTRQRMYSSRQVTSHVQDTRDEVEEADRRGLLGPLEGRWAEFMRGTIGSTGNEEDDLLLNQLRTDLKLMGSGTMMAHFGARGGQNLIEDFNRTVLNSGKMSKNALNGSLNSIENWLGTYGQNPAQHSTGRTSAAPAGAIRYDLNGNPIR